jgi:imidazoleglycerol-phosphate dehydratase
MAAGEQTAVRLVPGGSGTANVETGLSILDHLLSLLARYGGFDLSLGVAPDAADAEVAAAGRALGQAASELLRREGVRGHGAATIPADEALAHIALEASGRPLLVSNVDLSEARVGGLGNDLAARFLEELAAAGGLTLHVRLMEGRDTQHVLEAIFKALGVALAQACRQRDGGKT